MSTEEARVCDDVSPAEWIGPRLTGAIGTVTATVPAGFDAYIRICHPARDDDGHWASWSRVAETTGRRPHPLMQWHAVVGTADCYNMEGSLWPGDDPERGNVVPRVLGPLCDLLAGHTAKVEECFLGLWEGYGWIRGNPSVTTVSARPIDAPGTPVATIESDDPVPPLFSAEEMSRARMQLPGRDYLLLAGPLSAALRIGWHMRPDRFDTQSPNLFWPADRAWCAASEIDFDSTLVGGTAELVDAILATPALDAWAVRPDDSLMYDADRINPVG
ncbi:MAG TPA: hypothetical protein VHS52_06550 [Acidimicrobiales bacterium]|nr:hypothetical protein [Acidimicrobiales bacterium]